MVSKQTLEAMTVAATALGWNLQVQWPAQFQRNGKTYVQDHLTTTVGGEVQCGEYATDDGEWLIVYNA